MVAAFVVSGLFGWAQDKGLWSPLRRRGTGLVAMMIITIGLSIFLRSLFQYFIGGSNYSYSQYTAADPWSVGSGADHPDCRSASRWSRWPSWSLPR